jgi:uncharacterized 2Fe-2S/4Fe-4S cluster protein (DUF4445 family)
LPAGLPAALAERLRRDAKGQVSFLLAKPRAKTPRSSIALTQQDVRQLQLATGAIRAGISILLGRADVKAENLQRVLVAGGFGSFIRRSNAQRIGLLPGAINHQRIQYVGNASLAGAKWALLSTRLRQQAQTVARRVKHVELGTDSEFQDRFAESMVFPPS